MKLYVCHYKQRKCIQGTLYWPRPSNILEYDSVNQKKKMIQMDMCPKTRCFPLAGVLLKHFTMTFNSSLYLKNDLNNIIEALHGSIWHQRVFTNKFKTVLSWVIYKMYVDYIFSAFSENSQNNTGMTILKNKSK